MQMKKTVPVAAPRALELDTLTAATGGSKLAEDIGEAVGYAVGKGLRYILDHPVKMDAGKI